MSSSFPVVTPADCQMLVGLPTTDARFEQARAARATVPDTFVASLHHGGLHAYRLEIIEPFNRACDIWKRWGVKVQAETTRAALEEALQAQKQQVMILFSHYCESGLELCDGMLADDDFVALLPRGYKGLLDLCACRPMQLVSRIKHRAPACSVCFASDWLAPLTWFAFYSHLFHGLHRQPVSYVQAIERTRLLLGRRWRRA